MVVNLVVWESSSLMMRLNHKSFIQVGKSCSNQASDITERAKYSQVML